MSLMDNAGSTGQSGESNGSVSNGSESQENSQTGNEQNQGDQGSQNQGQQNNNEGTSTNNDIWFYDDGKPGEGNRPEWLSPKYKTAAEQAKAYNEAQKKLGAFKGAPETYDLSISDMPDVEFHPDDPFIKDFLDDAKKNNVSQEYVSQLLKTYVTMSRANLPNPQKEMEKLGANAQQDLQILAQWGNNHLTPDEFTLFKNMMTTADSVRLFEKLRGLATGPDTKPAPNGKSHRDNEADVRKLIHDPRFDTDENFRNEVRQKLKAFSS